VWIFDFLELNQFVREERIMANGSWLISEFNSCRLFNLRLAEGGTLTKLAEFGEVDFVCGPKWTALQFGC
jgi:hypothetical protein